MLNGLNTKIIAALLAIAAQLLCATPVIAQSSPDTRAPLIELDAVADAVADNSQVFTAQVVDDRLLKDVLLYHRRSGQQAFTAITMQPLGDSAYYTASLKTDPEDLRAIEYYVQARDDGGNRTVEGFAFDPYTRVLTANNSLVTSLQNEPVASTPTNSSGRIRWWHVAAGILVAGAIASAASGGSDSGGGESQTAPLTFTLTGP